MATASAPTPPRPPLAPRALPLLGHSLALVSDPLAWLRECDSTEPVRTVRTGTREAYLVCRPDLVHRMLVTHVDAFDKGGPFFSRVRELLGDGLASASHSDHQQQRRIVQPAFAPHHLARYEQAFREESEALAASWHPGGTVDLLADAQAMMTKLLCRTVVPSVESAEAALIAAQFPVLIAGLFTRTVVPYRWINSLPTPGNRRFTRARDGVWAAADRIVAAAHADPEAEGMLAALLAAGADSPDLPITDENLRHQICTFFLAGIETTASLVAWTFFLLTGHPAAEQRLYEEIDAAPEASARQPGGLRDLPHLRNVLTEALRLYPPVPMLTRASTAEVTLDRHTFPPGTDFYFSAYQLQHDESVFAQAERFLPDRWNSPPTAAQRQAFIPFVAGKRKCIGDTFALTAAAHLVAAICARWRLRARPGSTVRPVMRASLTPAGLRLIAEPR
ncbi:cytochrome P450 [Kitasatospora sp. NPDC048298]|uniref:cytochrome P450 n=1 Tax=Kitasatospora sp. NPDC048298 TaxID=3364049 RepID=UPI0037166573